MTATTTTATVFQARGLVKRYGCVTALDGADFVTIAENLFLGRELLRPGLLGISMFDTVAVMTGAKDPHDLPEQAHA
jgi:hypothetical protein